MEETTCRKCFNLADGHNEKLVCTEPSGYSTLNLPTGTVTFLFTDIEGSTKLWETHPEAMRAALPRHDELIRASIERFNGRVFKTMGDGYCAVFETATEALNAAVAAQLALLSEDWGETGPIRVRMGLHTGEAEA